METKAWKEIKDNVYVKKGTFRLDKLDREFESFMLSKYSRKQEKKIKTQFGCN
jgi:hypothetical protein